MGSALNHVDRYLIPKKSRIVSTQVLVKHVEELCSEFNACGATTAHDEREKAFPFFVRGSRQTCTFQVCNDLVPDQMSITDVFEKVAILQAFDSMGICHGT